MTDAARTSRDRTRRLAFTGLAALLIVLVAGCVDRETDVDARPSASSTPAATRVSTALTGTSTEPLASPTATAFLRPTSVIVPTAPTLPDVLDLVVARAAEDFGVPASAVMIASYEEQTWSSTALGCPQEGRSYAQIVTRGFRVTLGIESQLVEYNVDTTGTTIVECEETINPTR